MTTVEMTDVAFDIPTAKNQISTWESELEEAKAGILAAAANNDLAEILRLSNIANELPKKIERLARKIQRETGEEVATKKAEVSARLQVLFAEFLRTAEVQAVLGELRQVNPKLRAVNIDFTGDATQPDAINLVGGYRATKDPNAPRQSRPRARWNHESFGTDENGQPKTLSSKEVVLMYGQKYGMEKPYDAMTGNERQQLLVKIVDAEGFKNLTKAEA